MTTIGMFDSGVGGLCVLGHLVDLTPGATHIYLADQAFAPYGERSLPEVRERALAAASALLAAGADEIVVACNTASAAALEAIRMAYPDVPVVGMEPAVKPAVALSRTGTVAVLATEATFQGELYASLVANYGTDATIIQLIGSGLAATVEAGQLAGPQVRRLLRPHIERARAAGADVLVLGCTHYPFIRDVIGALAGPDMAVVDPAPAVARQAAARAPGRPAFEPTQPTHEAGTVSNPLRPPAAPSGENTTIRFLTTGDPHRFAHQIATLVGLAAAVEQLHLTDPAARE